MRNPITALPGLRRATAQERRDVMAVSGLAALLGLGLLLTSVGSYSVFVAEFGAGALPFLYLAAAVINVALGGLDLRLADRTSLARRAALVGAVTAATAIGTALLAITSPSRVVIFLLPLSFELAYVLGQSLFLAVASTRFDLRQSKRLLSTAFAGRWVSYALLGPVVALWASGFRPEILVLGGGVVLAATGARSVAMSRDARVGVPEAPAGDGAGRADSGRIRGHPLTRSIVALTAVAVVLLFLAEYLMYERADAVLAPADLPVALALIGSAQGFLILVMSVSASGSSLRRLGVGGVLIATPLALVLTLLAFVLALRVGAGTLTLVAAALVYVVEASVRESLGRPARVVLYQLLPRALASRTLALAEGPLVAVLAAATSLLIAALVVLDAGPEATAGVILVLLALSTWIGVVARRHYVAALETAFVRRELGEGVTFGREVRDLLMARLADHDPGRAVAAARMVLEVDPGDVGEVAPLLVHHRSADVRSMAWRAVSNGGIPVNATVLEQFAQAVEPELQTMELFACRAIALRAAIRQGEPWADEVVGGLLAAGDLSGCAAALDGHGHRTVRARQILAAAVSSPAPSRRRRAAHVLGLSGGAAEGALLCDLLADGDGDVRREAVAAIPVVGTAEVWASATALASDPELFPSVAGVLAGGGFPAAEALAGALKDRTVTVTLRCRLARVAARNGDEPALQAVLELTRCADPGVRQAAFEALGRAGFTAAGPQAAFLRQSLESMAACIVALLVAAGRPAGLLRDAVLEAVSRERAMVIQGLVLLGHRPGARAAVTALGSGGAPLALELLDVSVRGRDRHMVAVVERPAPPPSAGAGQASVPPVDAWIRLLQRPADPCEEDQVLTTVERVVALKASVIFAGTPAEVIVDLARGMEEHQLDDGTVLFEQGDPGDRLFVLVEGQIAIVAGGAEIARLSRGDAFGELALLDGGPRSAGAVAVGDVLLLSLGRRTFHDLMTDRPEVTMAMFRYVAGRLRGLTS